MKQAEIEKTKEKRSLPMHESRNVDTSEKNAPGEIKIEYNDEKFKNMKYCEKYDSME